MARITHPRFQPGRVTDFDIEFVDGFAEVDLTDKPILHQALVQHGYAELEELGYEVKSSWRKPELIERLAQHLELSTEKFAIAELPDGTVIGDGKSIATLPVAQSSTED